MHVYHVVSNLEKRFASLDEALEEFQAGVRVYPWVPGSRMYGEDDTTPRICVAYSVEQCLSAIGLLGTFRRCLGANEDAFNYGNFSEVYPVIILVFEDDDIYEPTIWQVPDAYETGEYWLTNPTRPVEARLVWFGADSIIWEEEDECKCQSVFWYDTPPAGMHHPWLDGKGHILDCSDCCC